MGLPKPDRYGSNSDTFKKPVYIKLSEGEHFVRFLHPIEETRLVYTHWVNRASIECIGADCPVCEKNQTILNSVNGDRKLAKDVSGYSPYQVRYYANILDRTQVKVHPDSEQGFENKRLSDGTFPAVCGETSKMLAEVAPQPSDKIKILAGGVTLFDQLDSINSATGKRDEAGNIVPIGIQNFDVVLDVKGTGRDRKITPVPQVLIDDVVTYDVDELHDLDKAIIKLTAVEIHDLLRGVTLKDIFAARRALEGDAVSHNTVTVSTDLATLESDVKSIVDNLLD